MRNPLRALALFVLLLPVTAIRADDYTDAIDVFQKAGESSEQMKTAYGYAVFPTIGKGGIGIGAARGNGRVFVGGKAVGETTMTQVSIGAQLGGQAFSQIILFENKSAFDKFTSGNFEFGAEASAVAITAGASAGTSTSGTSAGASTGQNSARTTGRYQNGMAIYTVAKGGLMYAATLGGQKYSYKAL